MKLFKDKKRGPKIKSQDVLIPEEYLEYERKAEAQKKEQTEQSTTEQSPFARRVDELVYGADSKKNEQSLQDKVIEKEENVPLLDLTTSEVAETVEKMLSEEKAEEEEVAPPDEQISLEDALYKEKIRANRQAKQAPTREKKETAASSSQAKEKDSNNTSRRTPRSKRRKKKRKTSVRIRAMMVIIVLLSATVAVMLGPLMRIDRVEVSELRYISEAQVEKLANNPLGQNLFLYNLGQAEEDLSYYPYVQEVQIKRHLPHWLEIDITERQPAGVLLNNGSYLQFSMDGVLLDNTTSLTNQNLPLITGFSMSEVPSPGEAFKDNARFSDILKIVNACSDDLLTMIQEINIKDRNNILAYTSQGIEIRIGNVDDIETRMSNLADIMEQVILSGVVEKEVSAIDIRYEKSPVIVLADGEEDSTNDSADDASQTYTASSTQQTESEAAVSSVTENATEAEGSVG